MASDVFTVTVPDGRDKSSGTFGAALRQSPHLIGGVHRSKCCAAGFLHRWKVVIHDVLDPPLKLVASSRSVVRAHLK
jgi:hypothetical protein